MQRVAEATVGGVPGHDDGFLARGSGDRALPGVVLPRPGVVEPFLVVTELAEHAGGEDHPEARLAEINVSGRVPTKMLGHHLLQLRDLLVQRGDHADLPDDDGRVGGLGGRGLTQTRRPQHRQQRDPPWPRRDADGRPATRTRPGCGSASPPAPATAPGPTAATRPSPTNPRTPRPRPGSTPAAWISVAAPDGSAPRSRSDAPGPPASPHPPGRCPRRSAGDDHDPTGRSPPGREHHRRRTWRPRWSDRSRYRADDNGLIANT